MFSGPVESVSSTNIFARASQDGRQFLVYSMKFEAARDLAMILPLPVPEGSGEDAVKFIDLSANKRFFQELDSGFTTNDYAKGLTRGRALKSVEDAPLRVVDVGAFSASFVPTLADFSRLDEQFKLSPEIWIKLPQYARYGFAVFKLKKTPPTSVDVHPMAFEFPRAFQNLLFFPTVHVHDGRVSLRADFDHMLYAQLGQAPVDWSRSFGLAKLFTNTPLSQGIIDPAAFVHRKKLYGVLNNQDVLIADAVPVAV